MGWSSQHISLIILLLIVACFFFEASIATKTTTIKRQRVGFLYTRTTGRCTPQFWSSRRDAWPRMVPQRSTVSNVFGSRAYERYRYDMTILEATARNDEENPFGRLLKQGSAALLNSYDRKRYPYKAWEVKTLVIQALVSKKSASLQAQRFFLANQACN